MADHGPDQILGSVEFNNPSNNSLKGYLAIFSVPRNYNFRNLKKRGTYRDSLYGVPPIN